MYRVVILLFSSYISCHVNVYCCSQWAKNNTGRNNINTVQYIPVWFVNLSAMIFPTETPV